MAVGGKLHDKILFFLLIPLPSHFHPFSYHSFGGDVVSQPTGNTSKILVPSEVHVDAALPTGIIRWSLFPLMETAPTSCTAANCLRN